MTSGDKSFTATGRMRKATHAEVCAWVLKAWNDVKDSCIINGFKKAEILGAEEEQPSTSETAPPVPDTLDISESESDENWALTPEQKRAADEAILRQFLSDTEMSNFEGFESDD